MGLISHGRFGVATGGAPALTAALPGLAFATEGAPLAELAPLRGPWRIMPVDAEVPYAIERLRAARSAIDDRHIVRFVGHRDRLPNNDPGQTGNTLAQHLGGRYFGRSDARIILIGKNGGLKSCDQALDLPALFVRIDPMPIRRWEMGAAR